MSFSLPKIYPITDTLITGLSHAEQVEVLAAGGASLIQLREKRASPIEFYRQAIDAMSVARRLGVQIIINDRVDIAIAVKADGVHLGQDDLPPDCARRLLGESRVIGFSTHVLEQALAADVGRIDAIVERLYVGLQPGLRRAAGRSVYAHLIDLVGRGLVESDGPPTLDTHYCIGRVSGRDLQGEVARRRSPRGRK